jgi:hypothetical protein
MAAARLAIAHPVRLPSEQSSRATALPVLRRIVRRTAFEGDGRFLRAVAHAMRAARSAGKSTLGSMVLVAMILAALGALAGVALRSLSGSGQALPAATSPVPVFSVARDEECPRADVPTEERSAATESVARVATTARATLPTPRVRGHLRSDRRGTHGRIHPTSARPGARRVVTSKPKLR